MGSAMFDDGHFYGSFAASGEQDTNTGGVRREVNIVTIILWILSIS